MQDGNGKSEMTIHISQKTILQTVVFVLFVLMLFYIKDIVLVLLTSIVVASFVESGVRKLKKYGIQRMFAVILLYLVTFLVFTGLFYAFLPIFSAEVSNFIVLISKHLPSGSILNNLDTTTVNDAKAVVTGISQNLSLDDLITRAQLFVGGLAGGFVNTASTLFGGLLNLIILVVVSFYLSIQERGVENFLRIIIPDKHEAYVIDLWQRTERKIGLWVQGQLLLGLIVGVLVYLGLALIGVKYAFLLGIVAAIFELIPFGVVLAAVPGIVFAYLDGGVSVAFVVMLFYVIVQQFEGYLLSPLIVKKVTGVSPLVVIISLLIGAKLAGFWGIILAVPVAVCLLEYFNDIEKRKAGI